MQDFNGHKNLVGKLPETDSYLSVRNNTTLHILMSLTQRYF